MPVVVSPLLGAPAPPPAAAAVPRSGLRNTLLGWDGSEWELDDPDGGVLLVEGGVRGMGMPPITHYRSESPASAGSYYRGTRVDDRTGFWPLFVYADGAEQDWITRNRAFVRTMWPTEVSTWRVVQPNAETRYLDIRYESGLDEPFDNDPAYRGWVLYGVTLTAEQPYWRGDPIQRTFDAPVAARSNFGPPGVVTIYPGASFTSASINNPGDVPVRVTWVLRGPLDSATVGVGSKMIDVPFPLLDGEMLTIYTEPDLMLALTGGDVDRTDELGPTSDLAGTIAPGGEASLSVLPVWSAAGGSIEATVTPLYYMAF